VHEITKSMVGTTSAGSGVESSEADAPELSHEMSDASATSVIVGRPMTNRRSRRWLFVTLAVVVFVFVAFLAATLRLIVFPTRDQPRHVDAIVSFNGSNEGVRRALAVSLAEKGYAPVLLFSLGSNAAADTQCPKVPRVSVVCFVDVKGDTRGEAEWAARYAQRHHWRSLMLVPGRAQATRARLLTERCFSGQLDVLPAAEPRPPLSEIVHEWGGLLDAALIHRSC
jgi:hypothetical protein